MSVFARAASMPTRLPTTSAVGSGVPATGGAGFSRPKPNSPRFFFSVGAPGGGLHSSTGGVPGSGMLRAEMRGSARAELPHGSADVAPAAGADHALDAVGACAPHASWSPLSGLAAGGDHGAFCAGAVGGAAPQGSLEVEGAGSAAGALQRSAVGAGCGGGAPPS